MKSFRLFLAACIGLALLALIAKPAQAQNPNQLIKLLDYIGADYSRAVENGQIKSEMEYEEMLQFQTLAREHLDALLGEAQDDVARELRASVKALGSLIQSKADPEAVASISKTLREKAMTRFQVRAAPRKTPSLENGRSLYQSNCTTCHGENGDGKGPSAAPLDPAPANFRDPAVIGGLSPFKAFNVISLGVEGTSMPGFSALTEEERWDLAFFLFTWDGASAGSGEASKAASAFHLSMLSNLTNEDLLQELKANKQVKNPLADLIHLRSQKTYATAEPDAFDFAEQQLEFAEGYFRDGQLAKAEQARVSAYLDGIEQIEPRLRSIDPELVNQIEAGFLKLRAVMLRAPTGDEIHQEFQSLRASLTIARAKMAEGPKSATSAFWLSVLIIVREGIEAALIVGAILGLLRASGDAKARVRVHFGWISALVAGVATWFISQSLIQISGAQRELVEGIAALLAAVVLFYVSYWLLSKMDSRRWMQFIQSHVKSYLATGSLFALTGLTFVAVYREGFETVLFYQGLVQSYPQGGMPIFLGFLTGSAMIVFLAYLMFKLQKKLPLRTFFLVTGVLLYLLAFILAGKGVWALQEGGFINLTPISFLHWPVLGIHPTLEGVLTQSAFLLAVVVGGIWMCLSRPAKQAE